MNNLSEDFLVGINVKENDKQSMSMPTTPTKTSSMAFTVDFDDLNNNNMLNINKKKLDIRDNIRKFAPPKPETIEKNRFKIKDQNSNQEKFKNNLNKDFSELSSKFTNNKNSNKLNDGATFLIHRMLYSEPNSLQSNQSEENETYSIPVKLSNNLSCSKDGNFLNQKLKENSKSLSLGLHKYSSKSSSFRSPSTVEMDSGVCDDDKSDDREYDDSLSQLKQQQQQRFFKSNDDNKNTLNSLIKQEEDNEHEIDDNISETGTYTVDLDNIDPIAEQARKRINEIFDENKKSSHGSNSSDSNSECNFTNENLRIKNKSNNFKLASIDAMQKIYTNNQNKMNLSIKKNNIKKDTILNNSNDKSLPSNSPILSCKNFGNTVFNKTINQKINNSNEKLNEVLNRNNKQNQISNKTSSKTQLLVKNNLIKENKTLNVNRNINFSNQTKNYNFNCNNQANFSVNKVKKNSVIDNLSRNNQKVDFNHKNSLNNVFEDTLSLKSEDISVAGSTDLSSIGSEKCKSDSFQTSTMRFNRAFALRRARLGIETPFYSFKNCKNNKQLSLSRTSINTITQQKNSNNQIKKSNISSMPENSFDRADGGRFSLRAVKVSNINKISNTCKPTNLSLIPCAISSPSHSLNRFKSNKNQILSEQRPNSVSCFSKLNPNLESLSEINKNIKYPNSNTISDSYYARTNSFDGTNTNESNYKFRNNAFSSLTTMSNASTNEDLSNLTDTINIKSLQRLSPFQLGRRIYSTKPHYMAQTNSFRSKLEENNLSSFQFEGISNNLNISSNNQSKNEIANNLHFENDSLITNDNVNILNVKKNNSNNSNSVKSLSALDYLVLSAVHQLSFKLRCKLRAILDAEKNKYSINNENRILIEELLPQVNISDYRNSETSDKTISRDLSNILKNLKRIEQSLEVVNLLLESNSESVNRTNNEIFNNSMNNNNSNSNNVADVSSRILDVNFFSVGVSTKEKKKSR